MIQLDLTANERNSFGKGAMRQLRAQGQTPAILYGPGFKPVSLSLETRGFTKTLIDLQRRNAVVSLSINSNDGESKRIVIIKDLQVDPVKDTLVHADFYEISMEKKYTFKVPLDFTGKAKGEDLGGVLNVDLRTIDIEGIAMDIPDAISVDISELGINDKISCKDLTIPDGIVMLEDERKSCCSIIIQAAETEEEEEEGETEEETATEPEGAEAA
jgi:large subunit ribosomal protein L25